MKVIKRDGRKAEFDAEKIITAVTKAFIDVDGEETQYSKDKAKDIANFITEFVSSTDATFTVEDIQNMVENKLMNSSRKDVARAYIIYRNDRNRIRQKNSYLNEEIKKALLASNVENQNANVDEYSFGGRVGAASDAVNKDYALNNCMTEMSRRNHINNEIYIHDLNSYAVGMHNCLSIPFDKLLANGFNTRQVDIRQASSINTAMQLVAVIFQLQSLQQFGGVSATHIDHTMVPYIRKSFRKHFIDGSKYVGRVDADLEEWLENNKELSFEHEGLKENYPKTYQYALDMTLKECEQSVEALYHNLNSLQSRSGCQLPFTSINYGTCTLPEGRMVTKALLEGCIKGVGKFHKTSIFPNV